MGILTKSILTTVAILFLASATCQEPDLHGYSEEKYDSLLAVNESLRDSIQILLPLVISDSIEIMVDDIYFELFDYDTRILFWKQGRHFTVKTVDN